MPADKSKTAAEPLTLPSVDVRAYVQSVLDWIAIHWLQIAIAAGAGVLIYLLLGVLRGWARKWKPAAGEHLGFTGIVGRCAARTNHFFMVMVSAKLVAGYANPPETLDRTVTFLFTLAAVFQGAIWARELILSLVERRTESDAGGETLSNAMGIIRLLVSVILFSVATIVVLDNLGVNVTGLVAGLGVGGIAIGLAAQGIFSDLFAALSIIFDKPFRRGETIRYDNTSATVVRIGLKTTRLRATTGERKIISNANLLQKEITNLAHLDHRRVQFMLGVIYQTDIDTLEAMPAMLKAIVEDKGGRFVRAGFTGFGDSALNFELEFDVYQPNWDGVYGVRHTIGLAILRAFNDKGIEFAYPTQTSFTAAPNGRAVMPYADDPAPPPEPAPPEPAKPRARRTATGAKADKG